MQRKHTPRVNEYQSSTSSHPVDDSDIKHQPDRVQNSIWLTRYSSELYLVDV